MELLFFWFNDDYRTLRNCGLSLSSRFLFSFNKNDAKKKFELDITTNPDYTESFFSDNILDITAIIGDNGVGKSNILELISDFLTIDYLFFQNWVSAFWNSKEKRIELHYHLFFNESNNTFIDGWKLDITNKNDIPINVVKIGNQSPSRYLPPRKNIVNISNAKIIKYSPILDFRKTPPEENSNDILIDISTNYLIYNDSDDFYLTTRDKLELHKHKNIERQYELSMSALAELPDLNIPKDMEVRFEKTRKVEYSDLPSYLRFFFEDFKMSISSRFNVDYKNNIE